MRRSIKAALLSALAFPGVGHFSLKKPIQGVFLSGLSTVCLYFLLIATIEIVKQLSVKIQSGEIPMGVVEINEIISQQLMGSDDQRINISLLLFVICWFVGIVDSFRIGWARDNNNDVSNKQT